MKEPDSATMPPMAPERRTRAPSSEGRLAATMATLRELRGELAQLAAWFGR